MQYADENFDVTVHTYLERSNLIGYDKSKYRQVIDEEYIIILG